MTDTTYANFVLWLARVNETDLPPSDIVAFNFGIFENANGFYTTYLIGSREFDATDDDWACNNDYVPLENYFDLLEHPAAQKDWREVLVDLVQAVERYVKSPEFSASFLASATAITVGFDDGDLERVR